MVAGVRKSWQASLIPEEFGMSRRRSTYLRPNLGPWWAHPLFLLPMLVSLGLIVMVLMFRIMGYPQ